MGSNGRADRLVRYRSCGAAALGLLDDGAVVPLGFGSLGELLASGADVRQVVDRCRRRPPAAPLPADKADLVAPHLPAQLLFSGINYRSLADAMGREIPDAPFFFSKLPGSVVGPGDDVVIPDSSARLDYQGQVAVVVGRRLRRVGPEEAMDHVLGFVAVNDVSDRALQFSGPQLTYAKCGDTFCPLGPAIALADSVPERELGLRTFVNGALVQEASLAELVRPIGELLSYLSRRITLRAGDLVSTGTPAGVGYLHEPPSYLAPGDVVAVEVDHVGRLENRVVA